MSNRQSDRKLLHNWIIANTAGFIMGCIFFIFFHQYFLLSANNVYKPERIDLFFASFTIPPILTGIFQWLVIKIRLPKISFLWVLTNIAGLYTGMIITGISFIFAQAIYKILIETNFHETGSKLLSHDIYYFLHSTIWFSIIGLLGGAVGGLLTGVTQVLLVGKQITLPNWRKWIQTITISWAISWSVLWAIFFILSLSLLPFIRQISVSENCNFYCIFVIKIIEILLWIGLGLLFGFLNGAISGRVLVCLLRESRQSQPEN